MKKSFAIAFISISSLILSFLLSPTIYPLFSSVLGILVSILFFCSIIALLLFNFKKSTPGFRKEIFNYGLWTFTLFLSFFLITEYALRTKGHSPGLLYPEWFSTTDSLIITEDFITDVDGITIANKNHWDNFEWGIKNGYYINRDGFRSPEFLPKTIRDTNRKSILFLGDSFTWGQTAKPIQDCFADKVRDAGYDVFNTGIGGADPKQYWLIAKNYIAKLQPDYCFLMFALANDEMWFDREVIPYHPLWFPTNIGGLSGYTNDIRGNCFEKTEPIKNPQDAYAYYKNQYSIQHFDSSLAAKICANSCLGTMLYKPFFKEPTFNDCTVVEQAFSDYLLDSIETVCSDNNVAYQLFLIPNRENILKNSTEIKQEHPKMFLNHNYKIAQLELDDYVTTPIDNHLNSKGHQVYAEFILEHLKSLK